MHLRPSPVQLPVETGWRELFYSTESTLKQTRQWLFRICVRSACKNHCVCYKSDMQLLMRESQWHENKHTENWPYNNRSRIKRKGWQIIRVYRLLLHCSLFLTSTTVSVTVASSVLANKCVYDNSQSDTQLWFDAYTSCWDCPSQYLCKSFGFHKKKTKEKRKNKKRALCRKFCFFHVCTNYQSRETDQSSLPATLN